MPSGTLLKISLFGESHGEAVGVTLEGFPPGMVIDWETLHFFLCRRSTGFAPFVSARTETDEPHIVSGVYQGKTTGTPLTAIFENQNVRSKDYDFLPDMPRPGHADYPAWVHSVGCEDLRGGGFHSGRLTLPYTFAGGLALQYLQKAKIEIGAHLLSVGNIEDDPVDPVKPDMTALGLCHWKNLPALNDAARLEMEALLLQTAGEGDSLGAKVECVVKGFPAGKGTPYFDSLESLISSALFSIPAVKGVAFGAGFDCSCLLGSEYNDPYVWQGGKVRTIKNSAGGLCGGLSTGMPILVQAAFRPAASISKKQKTISLSEKCEKTLELHGRHDCCPGIRAVPVVESALALTLMDVLLCSGGYR